MRNTLKTAFDDALFGLRVLRSSPGFSAVAVLTLALGISANTTVFSWVDAVLLHSIPGAPNTHELAVLETLTINGEYTRTSYPDYRDYRDSLKLVSGMAAVFATAMQVGDGDNGQQVWGELVSANYFDTLGIRPLLGRFFLPEEAADPPASYPLVVVSQRLWKTRLRGDSRIIGKTLRINRRPLTIIGVAPPDFYGSMSGVTLDLWIPLTMIHQLSRSSAGMLGDRPTRNLDIIARLKPGVTLEQARAEAEARARELAAAYPRSNTGIGATFVRIAENHTGGAPPLLARPLKILLGVCAVVLLIVCANVGNLLLARATARQKEFAIRLAMGAGRLRLARQLLTETLLVALAGGGVGMLLAPWISDSLVWLFPPISIPVRVDTGSNARALGFTVLVCVFATLAAGMAPLLCSLKTDVNEALKEGGRGEKTGGRSHRLRSALVISEVALAAVALIGAGLFVKSFQAARAIRPGFDPEHVLVATFHLAMTGNPVPQQHEFCERLRRHIEARPGVIAAGYAESVPLTFGLPTWQDLEIEGYIPSPAERVRVSRNLVAPGYFDVLRIPRLDGRDFTARDDETALPVMIVNEQFARRYLHGGVLGRKIRWGKRVFTVVGLVKDSKYYQVTEAPTPHFYVPFRQGFALGHDTTFFIRTTGAPGAAIAMFRREAASLDPNATVFDPIPMTDSIGASLYPLKVAATLLSALGLLSLLLAGLGLYSVMAYAVTERTQEVGIRMALGAQRGDVLRMLLYQGLALTGVGLLAGTALALLVMRFVGGMLVNVTAADPATFAAAALFLALVAALASYLPARRATRSDPMIALRCQ